MAESVTCDRCSKSSTRPASWFSVRYASRDQILTFGERPRAPLGDFCSIECLLDAAREYKAALDSVRAKAGV